MKKKILWIPFYFLIHYLPNHIINKIPFYFIRHFYYKLIIGIKIGSGSSIHMNVIINKRNIKIGNNSAISRGCYLDGRGGLIIGNNVSVSPGVQFITASHDVNSSDFKYIKKQIIIEDYVWIGTNAIILPGVKLCKGSVVAAGSVVSKDVEEYNIVGGVPSKFMSLRNKNLNYNCRWFPPFD
ncbi:maltose O-acetyltransferase [Mariniflexile fucanivorans]|uniref:Maltose O-acetyltransferase n=1 Tax=Mariniflexile fucanivorans TaxID=264023 RepID=A0A4R1RS06_9FLAO|nr:acyltransferase [Mariniflexile fucanivorans]TCL69233.1 maltose O-acetyltransferase [Mariniflexile fucanivorans]